MKRLLIALAPSAAVAAANYAVADHLAAVGALACLPCVAWLVAAPLALGLLVAVALPERAAAAPAAPPTEGALGLLALLQEKGRLVDFLEEDVSAYSDEQIGAAARAVHAGCRKVLHERIALEPVLAGAEGEVVEVPPGFDPAAIRLSGNVVGSPPFRGVLRHAGWRARAATLPERRGQDPNLIAAADVEIT
jgi:hypothetical protein